MLPNIKIRQYTYSREFGRIRKDIFETNTNLEYRSLVKITLVAPFPTEFLH